MLNIVEDLNYSSIVIGIVISIIIAYLIRYNRKINLPGPSGYPIIGNILELKPPKLLHNLLLWKEQYGSVYTFSAFGQRFIAISNAKLAKEVLHKRPKTFTRIRTVQHIAKVMGFEGGLFHAEGAAWSRARRITAPPFSKKSVNDKLDGILNAAVKLVDRLKGFANNKAIVEMKDESFLYTLGVLVNMALGQHLDSESRDYFFSKKFSGDLQALFNYQINRGFFPLSEWLWKLTPMYHYEVDALQGNLRMDKYCAGIISKIRAEAVDNATAVGATMIEDMIYKKDAAKSKEEDIEVSDTDLLANIKTFFIAGSETTSIAITWMCYYISKHDDIRETLQCEAASFFEALQKDSGDSGIRSASASTISAAMSPEHLPMAHAVCRETLRVASPAAFASHELADGIKSITLSNGVTIDSKDRITVHIEGLLFDKEAYGEDAYDFRPQRWLEATDEQLAKMNDYFATFGGGARICPGMNVAFHEAIMALMAIVHHFDVELACPYDEIHKVLQLTTAPNKMPIQLKVRQHSNDIPTLY